MGSKHIVYVLCLLGALAAAACSDQDAVTGGGGGTSGTSGGAGGKGSAGASANAGAATGGGDTAGGAGVAGEAGMAGGGTGGAACTDYTAFVHSIIEDDTNATSAPRPVNGVVFCPDPADPAAYKDLFPN